MTIDYKIAKYAYKFGQSQKPMYLHKIAHHLMGGLSRTNNQKVYNQLVLLMQFSESNSLTESADRECRANGRGRTHAPDPQQLQRLHHT